VGRFESEVLANLHATAYFNIHEKLAIAFH
jgi:hypothetical protein